MVDLDPKWLASLLHKQSVESSVVSVLECKCLPAASKGDNYASDITRVSMKVALGNGDEATKSLIVKTVPNTELRSKQIRQWGIFKKEIKMYNEVLYCMDELFKEMEDVIEPLWPACIYTKPYTTIVCEDQKVYGFKMASRFEGMGLDEAKMALNGLAKFHVASLVLKDREALDPSDFTYALLDKNPSEMLQLFHDKSIDALSEIIEAIWSSEWKYYSGAIQKLKGRTIELWKNSMILEENSKFNVLNHGDFWVNNMMFKYITDTDTPCDFRMLDFQMSHYNSLVFDILYFTNTSLKVEVRKDNMDELIAHYHKSLIKFMKYFNLEESRMPTLDELQQEIDKKLIFGLIVACTLMPLMKTDPEDVYDIEEIIKKAEEQLDIDVNKKPFLGKVFTALLKLLLPEYKAKGIL